MSVNLDKTNDCRGAKFCVSTIVFIWFVINILQSVFTTIHEDEAYYALFGEHLAWGYFDHPPMVALMTFLSGHLFSGTLGVRFFTIIVSCLSLWVTWRIATFNSKLPTDSKLSTSPFERGAGGINSTLLFFTIACSIVMINLYGFVTTPDVSLLLFSALFLLIYQRYLAENSWKNTLLMGLTMALMVYSKYHAFLLLGLIVLSNLKLLKDGKFWVSCFVTLVLLTPHIVWQVNADFPSLRYHLSGRSEPFRWSYFLEYLPNQLLVFNPFTFGAVVYVLLKRCVVTASEAKQSREDVFERGLCFILVGFFFFFWLMTFRGHVEPHWTAVTVIPMVVLLYRKSLVDNKLIKYIKWVIAPSLALIIAMRIALLTPLIDSFGFCTNKAYYEDIAEAAGNRPVAFRGSFQQPALYHYFTGKESSAFCTYYDRKTQYDLWQFDTTWMGKPVYVYDGQPIEHFQSANRLATTFIIPTNDGIIHTNDTLLIPFSIHNPYHQAIDFQDGMVLKLLLLDGNEVRYGFYDPIRLLQPNETYSGLFTVILGQQTKLGKNRLLLGIGDNIAIFAAPENAVNVKIASP